MQSQQPEGFVTTSRAGPVQKAVDVYHIPASGDHSVRSFYCTQSATTYVRHPIQFDRKAQRQRAMSSGKAVSKINTGYSNNRHPLFVNERYKPEPQNLSKKAQEKALVAKRLEYEGDLPMSIYKSDFLTPEGQREARRQYLADTAMYRESDGSKEKTLERLAEKEGVLKLFAQPEDYIPRQVFQELSGYERNNNSDVGNEFVKADYEDKAYQASPFAPGSTMQPSVKLESKRINQINAENDFKGPSRFSTTYKTFHNEKPLERAPHLHPINEYESDVQIDVGPLEPTGFTHNITQLYEHRAVPKEMVAVEPSSEFVEHLKKLPIVQMRRNKETNPLVDDSAYYEKYPNQEKNFNSKPPTIMKISYQNPPYFDGSEAVPRQVFMDKSGYSVNNMPAIGRPLGSGAYEFDNGLGHEVEGVTQQQVKLMRDKRPMEYEQLHLGRKMRSVYQTSYADPQSPHRPGSILRPSIMAQRLDEYDRNRDITLQSPASTRVFQSSIIEGRQIPSKGKGVDLLSGDTRLLTISERENIIGVMRDKHHGLGEGRSVTNNFKEETGHSHNVLPVYGNERWKPEPLYLSSEQQEKGLVSKRLEYEGDVPTTIYKSDYISPDAQRTQRREYLANTAIGRDLDKNIDATCQRLASKAGAIKLYAQKEDHLPRQVFISPSGFTRAVNQLKLA